MYRDCYFRTSSKPFDLSNLGSRFVHLTNDAVQMNSEDYGKFESGNKLSINDFQRYLDQNYASKSVCFMRDLFPVMERLVTDSFRAVYKKIDPARNKNAFEIFGYDFMIDDNFKVYLIEANTNPNLEVCSPLLARIIPELLDNSFRIAIDPLFQPPAILGDDKTSGQGACEQGLGRKAGLDINTPVLHEEPDKTTNASSVHNNAKTRGDKPPQPQVNVANTKNRRKFELLP